VLFFAETSPPGAHKGKPKVASSCSAVDCLTSPLAFSGCSDNEVEKKKRIHKAPIEIFHNAKKKRFQQNRHSEQKGKI